MSEASIKFVPLSAYADLGSSSPSLQRPPTEREETALSSMFERAGYPSSGLPVRATDMGKIDTSKGMTPKEKYAMTIAGTLSGIYGASGHLPSCMYQSQAQAYRVACLLATELDKSTAHSKNWPGRLGTALANTLTSVYLAERGPPDQSEHYRGLVEKTLADTGVGSIKGVRDDDVLTAVYDMLLGEASFLDSRAKTADLRRDCYYHHPPSTQ